MSITASPRLLALLLPLTALACATSSQAVDSRSPQPVVDADDVRAIEPGAPLASTLPATTASVAAKLPLTMTPRATTPAISEQDLQSRLYIFAADSMLGRAAGELGNVKATDYIARELRRIGLQPAGENGTYFQEVPLLRRGVAAGASIAVGGQPIRIGTDAAPVTYDQLPGVSFGTRIEGQAIPVIYGGTPDRIGITAAQARGKLVVLSPYVAMGGPIGLFWQQQGGFTVDYSAIQDAAGVAFVVLDLMPSNLLPVIAGTSTVLNNGESAEASGEGPVALMITNAAAQRMLGADPASLQPGAEGRTVSASIRIGDTPVSHPARNVVAMLPGSDPALKGQYVVVGAHSDHVGTDSARVDHDSLRAFNRVFRPGGADTQQELPPSPARTAQMRSLLDSLRQLRPARVDTVYNGADDDASGSMALLEIAESFAAAREKPRRSTLFVWHTAEEAGLFGAQWYADNPTVERDSIVTMLNIDMIGRGGADDLRFGKPGYLQLIGSRRLSTELGDLVEQVNSDGNYGLSFDYQFDANGHPQQYYCRSDHYEYAKHGIPVTFFSTGGHPDYHQLTDEPQYINYPQLTLNTRFIADVTLAVANRDSRPVVDGVVQGPGEECVQ